MITFSVLREPTLTAVGPGGVETVGLADALVRAHELRLALPDALDEAAVIRLLLAATIDALGQPRDIHDWGRWWRDGRFNEDALNGYFDTCRDRFDLFGAQPAWQVADLEAVSGERKPSSLLILAAASGNNVPLFSSRTEGDPPPLTPAAAFLALLRVHAWDTAAIKTGAVGDPAVKGGKTTGNRTGPLGALGVVIPQGRTLFETLLLNVPVADRLRVTDAPWWRQEPPTPEWRERDPRGLLDLLTWQSRRVRLFPEITPDGSVVVREVLLCAGDRMRYTPDQVEPHSAWRTVKNPKAGQQAKVPARHHSGKALWRGIAGLLAIRDVEIDTAVEPPTSLAQLGELWAEKILPPDYPLDVLAVGVEYGNQSAVVDNVYVDSIPLPISALGLHSDVASSLRECADQAEQLRRALNDLASDVRRATGAEPIPWDKGGHPGDHVMALFDAPFRQLLRAVQVDPEARLDAMDEWKREARSIVLRAAEPVLAAAPPAGFLGRRDDRGGRSITVPQAEMFFLAKVHRTVGQSAMKEEKV